jgi:hypothetical protein
LDDKPIWAVCLYMEGGSRDGESTIEFVRADIREDAITQAEGLNMTDDVSFQVSAAAQMPETVF